MCGCEIMFSFRENGRGTVVMLETAYKEAALGKTQVYAWFSRFRNGELSLVDQPCSGRPSTSRKDENIAIIHELILEDRRRTIDDLVDLSGVSWSFCQWILSEELQLKRVAAKFMPHMLTADQRQSRVDASRELKEHLEIDPDLFLKVITGDESWCYACDPETSSKENVLRTWKRGHGRGEEKNDGGIKRHHFDRVSGLLRKVENTFRPVHCIKWTVL